MLLALTVPFVGAVGLVTGMAADDNVPLWVVVLTGVFFAGFFGAGIALVRRAGTVIDGQGISIRSGFRTRFHAWSDIQDVQEQPNPLAGMAHQASRIGVVYDTRGSRIELPWVNDLSRAHLDSDIALVRQVWTMRRGDEWRPNRAVRSDVVGQPAPDLRVALDVQIDALVNAAGAFLLGALVYVALLLNGGYAGEDTFADRWLGAWQLLALLPLATYVGTLVWRLSYRRCVRSHAT